MANAQARKILSDVSVEELENSEGFKMVVDKQNRIYVLRDEISNRLGTRLSSNNEKILKKQDEIKEIDNIGFFKKLAKLRQLKKQKESLEMELEKLKESNEVIISVIEMKGEEIHNLQKEISDYIEELKKKGIEVTVSDIECEYNIIKVEIEERKKQKPEEKPEPEPIQEEKPVEPKAPRIEQNKKAYHEGRPSTIDRFKARLRKYEEHQAKQSEETEKQSQ